MPDPSSYYASPSGPGSVPLPSTPTYPNHAGGGIPSPQVFAIGSVIPPPQLNQPPVARSTHPDQQYYSSAMSPPPTTSYGYGAEPQPQMYQQQSQPYYPQQQQLQQPQYDYGGAPMAMDPYGGPPAGFATSPGAYPQASPIDRLPPPPAFIPQQQGHQQVQHQQQPQRVQQTQPQHESLDDAYGGF